MKESFIFNRLQKITYNQFFYKNDNGFDFVNIDNIAKYRNYLLPLMDIISIILGYYFVSVLITDSFLMQPTSAVTMNEILIGIVLSIIVYQIVFRVSKRYSNIIRYENNQDYILYIVLSIISILIVSIIEELILHMVNPSIKLNIIIAVADTFY